MSCVFCQIAAKEIQSDLIYEDEEFVAFRDLHPQAPVHFLVMPRKHVPRLDEMEVGDFELIGKMAGIATDLARREGIADGFRVAVNCGERGGQTIWHVHMHVLGGRQLRDTIG
ncbi:MAG: histidine triad nucleotide-binding protein [Dehalococcoidia bacterium]